MFTQTLTALGLIVLYTRHTRHFVTLFITILIVHINKFPIRTKINILFKNILNSFGPKKLESYSLKDR